MKSYNNILSLYGDLRKDIKSINSDLEIKMIASDLLRVYYLEKSILDIKYINKSSDFVLEDYLDNTQVCKPDGVYKEIESILLDLNYIHEGYITEGRITDMRRPLNEELMDINFDEFDEIIAKEIIAKKDDDEVEIAVPEVDADDIADDFADDDLEDLSDDDIDDILLDFDDEDDGYLDTDELDDNLEDEPSDDEDILDEDEDEGDAHVESVHIPRSSRKHVTEGYYRGIKPVEFIGHGEWADPELKYKDTYFNYWDIEDALWCDYLEDKFDGVEELALQDPVYEEKFSDWLATNNRVIDYLDDCIYGGCGYTYDDNGEKVYATESVTTENRGEGTQEDLVEKKSIIKSSKSLAQMYESKRAKKKNKIVEALLVDNTVDDIERVLKDTLDSHGISAAERVSVLGLILDRMLHASDEEVEAPEYLNDMIGDVVEDKEIADLISDTVQKVLNGDTEPLPPAEATLADDVKVDLITSEGIEEITAEDADKE